MPETLTESFCERCGTRYEFKAPTRLNPLRKTRGVLGGLKNYLTSQDDLSDAMNDAMRTEEGQLAAAQLEAFHESFNFCIDCRQYTCVNCWNDAAGRCRSCAPVAGTDDLAERLAASVGSNRSQPEHVHVHEPMVAESEPEPIRGFDAWPSSDLPEPTSASNGHVPDAWPTDDLEQPEPVSEPEPEPVVAEVEPEPEPVVAEVEPEPVVAEVEFEPEPVVAEAPRLTVVAWDSDTDYEVYQPEPVVAEVEFEPEPEPEPAPVVADAEVGPEHEPVVAEAQVELEHEPVVAEAEVEPEHEPVVAEVEPEPVVAEAELEPEPEPEPEPQPRRIAPISETILRFPRDPRPAAPPSEDVSERIAAASESPEVAARRAQMDLLGLGDPGEGPVTPQRPAVMPYRSRGAAVTSNEIAARAGGSSFWEASAREVAGAAAPIGVQNCTQCSLSLSANARFCRRCGTRQAQSA